MPQSDWWVSQAPGALQSMAGMLPGPGGALAMLGQLGQGLGQVAGGGAGPVGTSPMQAGGPVPAFGATGAGAGGGARYPALGGQGFPQGGGGYGLAAQQGTQYGVGPLGNSEGVLNSPSPLQDPKGAVRRAMEKRGVNVAYQRGRGVLAMMQRAPEIVLSAIMRNPAALMDDAQLTTMVDQLVGGLMEGQKLIGGGGQGVLSNLMSLMDSAQGGSPLGMRLQEVLSPDELNAIASLALYGGQSKETRQSLSSPLAILASQFQEAEQQKQFQPGGQTPNYLQFLLNAPGLAR